MLSRISGDEFLLLLNPIQSEQEVAEYIHFMLQRLKAPFFIDGSEIFASTSIGVSLYPEHGRSYEVLRQNADIAMYRVKSDGKGAAAFFDASMEREALARMKVEQSLRLAILEKRFCCAFQAKVDIRTQDIKGIEALVRLRDDEGVIQAPGTFINLAVELGLIDELTHLVLAEIVRSIDLINETFGHDTTISINVAAKQAGNPEFMRSLAQALEATGYPERFMIEVTEDAFVTKTHFQNEILPIFRKLGVGISIDDFGIGYSSLSALADITADEIKIDRSFITDIHKRPRSQGILRAIESLSEALGMTVIAEGIETFEELAYLQAATKIRYAQGYYFSRPMFLEELKPVTQIISETRVSSASRPREEARHVSVARRALSALSGGHSARKRLLKTPWHLFRQRRQRRHGAVAGRADLHGDQRHRDQIVITDDADDIHDAALAEFFDRGLVDGIGDLLVAIERGGEIIERGLVVPHVVRPPAGREIAQNLRIEAGLERERIMRGPFILRGPLPRGDHIRSRIRSGAAAAWCSSADNPTAPTVAAPVRDCGYRRGRAARRILRCAAARRSYRPTPFAPATVRRPSAARSG